MFRLIALAWLAVALPHAASAQPQPAPPPQLSPAPSTVAPALSSKLQITWEVRNRFRLFREERDFLLHAEALRERSVLGAEQALAMQSDGRGWARNTVNRLCIDLTGRVSEPCTRDGVKESYLTPTEHPVTVRLTGAVPVGATCAWSFRRRRRPAAHLDAGLRRADQFPRPLRPPHRRHRRRLQRRGAAARRHRDHGARHLIAGLGDSIASGEGNPDRPIALSDEGFCFRSYIGGGARSTIGRAAPATRAGGPARRRKRCRPGSATARCGSTPPAIARCTATRPAPRWRSRRAIRTSR